MTTTERAKHHERHQRQETQERHESGALATALGPSGVEVHSRHLRIGEGLAAVLLVASYPAEVGPAWLEPLLAWPGRLDLSLHIEPLAPPIAASRLRRQRARLESVRRADAHHGRLGDPATDAAATDAADLADRVARGAARLFRVGLHLTVHAPTLEELTEAVAQIRSAGASVMLDLVPATWRQLAGWTSGLPLGRDALGTRRVLDTDALACAFPLASADLPAPQPGDPPQRGILYGLNAATNGIVWWDRWSRDNHNAVILARSGAGKSYLVKLEILRSLFDGVTVHVVDPEDEYPRLAQAVGGTVVRLGAPSTRLNPLDPPPGDRRPDTLTRRALFLHTLVGVLLATPMPPAERAALDRAILAAYATAGLTGDPATWARPAPLMRDLATALATSPDPAAATLAARLAPWTSGSFNTLFDGPTTDQPAGHLVVWSTRALADELRAAGMLLALDAIWRHVDNPTPTATHADPRHLVIVDEAWTLLREGAGATFLYKMAKAARKRRAGLTVITQDAADLLGSDLGQAVVANAATQILMRQAPQAIDAIADAFGLTTAEARTLLTAGRGEALLLSGAHRIALRVVSSPTEHQVCVGDLDQPEDPS